MRALSSPSLLQACVMVTSLEGPRQQLMVIMGVFIKKKERQNAVFNSEQSEEVKSRRCSRPLLPEKHSWTSLPGISLESARV